ncbi:hypothetical protein P692DRAFT_20823562 [Suillus brevipes Sb2]|nr:hypothetical protein P692DRAFT_20823562 [Suillus brevipes Sb2]
MSKVPVGAPHQRHCAKWESLQHFLARYKVPLKSALDGQTFAMQQTSPLNTCSINLNLRIKIDGTLDDEQRKEGLQVTINSCVDSESALPQSDQTPAIAEDMILADVRQRLAAAEKSCSHYFELFKKYRLRWLEENQRADILGKYAPADVDPYSPAQIQWDAPSPCPDIESEQQMGSEVFSAGSSMGTMPKKTVTQADYFWAKSNSLANAPNTATAATTATTIVNDTTNPANTVPTNAGGGRWQITAFLRRAAQCVVDTARDIWAALCAAAKLAATFRRHLVYCCTIYPQN